MSNFNFKKIDAPGPAGTYAYISADGVDLAGEAVGNYGNVDGDGDGTFHGFTAQAGGSFTTFDPLGSTNTDVVGITTSGEVFGNYVDNVLKQHGFVDNGGVITQIDEFLANSTTISGVNDQGVIYGSFADSANKVHGFVDNAGTFGQLDVPGAASTSIVGVNASGTIVGTYTDAQFKAHGFVESSGSFKTIDPAGSIFTSVVGVSDAGAVVGNYQDSANNQHSFIDNNGVITTISIPGATSTGISAINAAGEIVGYYADSVGNIHGFIDENGTIITVDVTGAKQTDILGVSATGVISGYYSDSSNIQHGFVGTPGTTVIESSGSTNLTEVGFNYYFYDSSQSGPSFKYGGTPFVEGELGGWTLIGAEQVAGGGYDVALKIPGADQYEIWSADSNGNYVSSLTGVVSGTSVALETLEPVFHQDLNGDGSIGLVATVIESSGSTSLDEVGNNFYFLNSSQSGPSFKFGGTPFVPGQFGAWTLIGAEQVAGGYDVALKVAGADQYTIWNTDSNGNYVAAFFGTVSGSSASLESFEPIFHQDLNGDGTIGQPTTVIESSGSTSLTEVGNNFYFYNNSQSGPAFKFGGTPFVAGEFGAWTLIGAEQVTGGYDVALKVAGADQYTVWNTDSNGNYVSALLGTVSGSSTALQSFEPLFHQDLNGNGTIGLPTTIIESSGSTSLAEVGTNFYFYDSSQSGPSFKYGGTPFVAGEFGAWTLIGAEQVNGGYDVALKVAGADEYTIWNTDGNGNYVAAFFGTVSGSSTSLKSFEPIFHQDLNGDGTIGPPTNVIESFGSTSLAEVGTNFYFYDSSQSGPSFKFGGTPFVAGEFGAWTLIGAEQVNGGYDVALKVAGADQYTVWNTDSSGNYVSALLGTVSGNSSALESFEPIFQQDLNGDGTIGQSTTVIESFGATSLTEVGNNFYFYNSSHSGPAFIFGGAPFAAGELGPWTPIGAEKVAGGYDVALQVAGADEYTVWNTDKNGIYVSAFFGTVSGNSQSMESFETIFHQDFNGDGTIGVVTTVIESAGSTTLEEVGDNFYFLSGGSIPTLKVDGTPFVVDERNGWTPIGAEEVTTPVNDTYDVALKVAGADQYQVWSVDSDGNYISALTGVVSGNSATLESYEPIFQQDLNGDGNIGVVTTVIEAAGSTALTEVANNFYFYSGGVGPELIFNGTPYVVGASGAWTPIGAEKVSGGGYDVALKVAGADQYTVWSTDSNGNYVSALFGTVSGSSTALESIESVFHQDLNGDGVIGTSATIATGATLELTAADSVSVQFNGPTGTLILDHSAGFTGQISNLTGNGSLSGSDQIDLKDIAFAVGTTTVSYAGTSTGGTLTVTDAQNHTANIALTGDYTSSTFTLSSDGGNGTIVIDPPVKQDLASGTLSFSDADSTGTHTVSVTPENGGQDYVGNFVADAVTAANGQDSVGWHFNFDSPVVAKTVSQSYDVTVTDHHADGTNSAITQPVTVTIAGPGNDGFVFHSGAGAEVVVNATSANTIELDGFSSVTSNSQLASLLAEAQAGQSQSMFQSENGGHDTLINLGNHDSITLTNVHLADLHASNFIIH